MYVGFCSFIQHKKALNQFTWEVVQFILYIPTIINTNKEAMLLLVQGKSISTQDHETLNSAKSINYIELLCRLS